MRRRHSLHTAAVYAVLLVALLMAVLAPPQSTVNAQAKSASIISFTTDKAAYFSGEMVTLALVVRNTGDSPLQILCSIVIVNSAGDQVYSYSRKYDLARGATSSYEFYWTVPYNALSGIYHAQSAVSDGLDGRFYSSRSTSFSRNSPTQSPRSATLLSLAVDKPVYRQGEVSAITVSLQNSGGSEVTALTAVDVLNPSGIQVYSGVRETRLDTGYMDKLTFTLPIPDNADNGTYQVQATIADKNDGRLYGSMSTTLYVQSAFSSGVVSENTSPASGFKLPDLGIAGGGQYLITGLLIALAIIVIIILIRNRPLRRRAHLPAEESEPSEIPPDEGKTDILP